MKLEDGQLRLSASDLMRFMACPHAAKLDLDHLHGRGPEPVEDSAESALLQDRGDQHEREYLESLGEDRVLEIVRDQPFERAVESTRLALTTGAAVIYQGALEGGAWGGWSDFLERVERPSDLGAFSYEVTDTKLKRTATPGHVLQLALYSDLLARAQGTEPEHAHVQLGDGSRFTIRLAEVSAYCRSARERMEAFVAEPAPTRPVPVGACPLCRWREHCAETWEREDSLFEVAGITRSQVRKLEAAGVITMTALAGHQGRVPRLAELTLDRLCLQARLQCARKASPPLFELRERVEGKGFDLLPRPDPGDLFYDIEGDPLYAEGGTDGLEYLHGVWDGADFTPFWAHDHAEERRLLARLIDFLDARLSANPQAHIYHYAAYEKTALRKLCTRHGLGEAQLDRWLREERFVDLYAVVRGGLAASEKSYSLKDLEVFLEVERGGEVKTAGGSIVAYENWRAYHDQEILDEIEDYTHDNTRARIPPAEMEPVLSPQDRKPIRAEFERRDPDLDPQLVWRGKDVADWSDLVVQAPPIYLQEQVHPKALIEDLRAKRDRETNLFGHFGLLDEDREAKIEFYRHSMRWSNRMILGDSLAVMASLAEREGLRGQVQCIYIDPPYGIRFNSNFQWSTTSRDVKDGNLDHLTREPEQVKAFRDTWRDGIHSYLTYLRDRLTVARDLLTDSGSCFVQIGDENVHRVRAMMDEVFGEANFVSQINFVKNSGATDALLSSPSDFILWYAKSKSSAKFRRLYHEKVAGGDFGGRYNQVLLPDGAHRRAQKSELDDPSILPDGAKFYTEQPAISQGFRENTSVPYDHNGQRYDIGKQRNWKTHIAGMNRLAKAFRLIGLGKMIYYRRFIEDSPTYAITNSWNDTQDRLAKNYVVETVPAVIERCILMTTDPGDLVLDPTCGSGTTAHVAEQWGRRWIAHLVVGDQHDLVDRAPHHVVDALVGSGAGHGRHRRRHGFEADDMPGLDRALQRRRAFRLDPDDANGGLQRLRRGRDAADQSAAADRDEKRVDVRVLLEDFERDGALAGDHQRIGERMEVCPAGLLDKGERRFVRLVPDLAGDDGLGAP